MNTSIDKLDSDEEIKQCRVCGEVTDMYCQRCRQSFYCGLEHQRIHWKVHKNECVLAPISSMVKIEDIQLQEDDDIGKSVNGEVGPANELVIELKPVQQN